MAEMIPEGQGRIIIFQIPSPAAGAEWDLVQPARVRWWVKSIIMQLVTDANTAERFAKIAVFDGALIVMEMTPRDGIPASETWVVQYYDGMNAITGTGRDIMPGFMPSRLILNNEIRIGSRTLGIQAGDRYSGIFVIVEEWIDLAE